MSDGAGVSHFHNFQKSLSGLLRRCGTGGKSTVGQGHASAFSGSRVSRLLTSEWRGCVAGVRDWTASEDAALR